MSGFHELALRRQTCRAFADTPVEHEKLMRCFESARLAPSGCNSQPWSFIAVVSPDKVTEMAALAQQLGANPYAAGAKAFVLILEETAALKPAVGAVVDSQYFAKGDLGAAAAYFALEAEEQGLGVCQIGIFDRMGMRKLLGIPAEKPLAALFAVGYPADTKVRNKDRKPTEALVKFV